MIDPEKDTKYARLLRAIVAGRNGAAYKLKCATERCMAGGVVSDNLARYEIEATSLKAVTEAFDGILAFAETLESGGSPSHPEETADAPS